MRFRIWILFMVVVPMVLTATLLTVFFVNNRLASLEDELQGRGAALARQVAAGSELGLFSGNRQLIESVASAALRDPDVDAIVVRDDGGVVMARLGADRTTELAVQGGVAPGFVVISERVRRPVMPLDDLYSSPTTLASNDLGSVVVVMATESLRKNRAQTITTALLVTGGLCALSVGLVLVYVRRVGLRLAHLSETVARIEAGDLSAQVGSENAGGRLKVRELDQLAVGIDAMARQISASHRDLAQRVSDATAELEQRRADAERASLAKSRFLAAASHDLRQPLHALGLFANQLSRRSLSGEDANLVKRIVESSAALSELLDALLDISRLDAGAITSKQVPVALAPLLKRLHDDFESQAEACGLRFIVRSTHQWVNADPMMIERILINLVANAIRYTATGTVMLVVRRASAGRLRIEVRDSGEGIPDDAQRLIFDEFVQLGNPERDHNNGLGLGLSIVQRMCRLMNCRYGVRSRVGRGSVFWVELPNASAMVALKAELPEADRRMNGRLVAVVEDDPVALDGLRNQLRSWGCEVCAAPTGAELMAQLVASGGIPAVILCDCRLREGGRGDELVGLLRQQFGVSIPAVLMNGDAALNMRDALPDAGFPVLSKPLRPGRLRAVLQGVFSVPPADR